VQSIQFAARPLAAGASVAGRAPLASSDSSPSSHFEHGNAGGFCTVCGGVWPCSQAPDTPGGPDPVPGMRRGS
jgi:hypothetical protein